MSDLPGRYLTFKPLFDRGEVGRSGTQRIPGSPAFRKSADKLSIYHINYVCNLVYSHILCKSWWSYSLNMSKYNTSHKHIMQYIFVYIYKPVWTHFGVQTFSQKSNVQVPLSSPQKLVVWERDSPWMDCDNPQYMKDSKVHELIINQPP